MHLTGEQIFAIGDFADGADCKVSKLAGDNSHWAQVVRDDEVVVWISPKGQIMDEHPGKVVRRAMKNVPVIQKDST